MIRVFFVAYGLLVSAVRVDVQGGTEPRGPDCRSTSERSVDSDLVQHQASSWISREELHNEGSDQGQHQARMDGWMLSQNSSWSFENVLESESRQLTFCRPVNSGIQCTQSSWSGCNCSVLMSFGPGDANSQHIRSSAATLQLPAKKPLAVYVVSAGDFRGIFNPAVATICNALRSGSSVPVRLEVRALESRHIARHQNAPRENLLNDVSIFSELSRGDVLIYVGEGGSDSVPWNALRSSGIYNIFYQPEPRHPFGNCAFYSDAVHELWDYSWKNIENCANSSYAPHQRYVPPGFLPVPTPPIVKYASHQAGYVRGSDKSCLAELQQRASINVVHNEFKESALLDFISTNPVQVVVHKGCPKSLLYPKTHARKSAPGFEAFRASQVLSAHGMIVSERSHAKDEEAFAGVVEFVELQDIPSRLEALHKMSNNSFDELVLERYKAYRARFDPAVILANADVYNLFARLYDEQTRRPHAALESSAS